MKKGIVLEGGGMRGAYTAGCLKWMVDNNIEFDAGCAISATAVFLEYFSNKDAKGLETLGKTLMCDKKLVGLYPLLTEGQLLGYKRMFVTFCQKLVPLNVETLRKSKMLTEIGVYNADLNQLEWIDQSKFSFDYLHASCVLPLSGRGVQLGKYKYYDGGVLSMFPVFRAIENQFEKTVFITTKPATYVRTQNGSVTRFFLKLLYGLKYPKMISAIDQRVEVYEKEMKAINDLVEKNEGVILRPSKTIKVSRLKATPEALAELFELGYQDTENRKEEILTFLGVQ